MKKLSIVILLLSALFVGTRAFAMGFSEAINQSKPLALLVYADWADDVQGVLSAFKQQEQKSGATFNFITMNIADKDTKDFNKMYHIYPNLPYVLLFKDRGKISRYLKKDCVLNSSCFQERLEFFIN